MNNWPIVKVKDIELDTSNLLNEIQNFIEKDLKPVLDKNQSWKGICLYKKKDDGWTKNPANIPLEKLKFTSDVINKYFSLEHVQEIYVYNLEKNSRLHPHRDMEGNLLLGMMRVHLSIKTNRNAYLDIGSESYHVPEGRFASFSTSELHSARNDGLEDRYHIVIDVNRCSKHNIFFPKTSLSIAISLLYSTFIIGWLVLRDLITKPDTIFRRIRAIFINRS